MKYYGRIGFSETTETESGIWEDAITEKPYYGDVLRSLKRWDDASDDTRLNDNVTISNRISIVADAFAIENLGKMKYATWNGEKWKITDVEEAYPRLILTLAGVWTEDGG